MAEQQTPQNTGNGDVFDIPLEIQAASARKLEEQRQIQAEAHAIEVAKRKRRGDIIKTGGAVTITAASIASLAYLGVQAMDDQAQQTQKENKEWSDQAEQNQHQQEVKNGMYDDNKINIQLPEGTAFEDDK